MTDGIKKDKTWTDKDLLEAREMLDDLITHRYRRWVTCPICGHFFEAHRKEPFCIMCCINEERR